jgi:hypothetical protein
VLAALATRATRRPRCLTLRRSVRLAGPRPRSAKGQWLVDALVRRTCSLVGHGSLMCDGQGAIVEPSDVGLVDHALSEVGARRLPSCDTAARTEACERQRTSSNSKSRRVEARARSARDAARDADGIGAASRSRRRVRGTGRSLAVARAALPTPCEPRPAVNPDAPRREVTRISPVSSSRSDDA